MTPHPTGHRIARAEGVQGSDGRRGLVRIFFNNGHVLDLGEPRRGKGGTNRIMELKVYNSLVPSDATPDTGCSLSGDTHTFGNTEEYLIRKNKGVKARQGERLWSNADGTGHVALHKGCYDDAIYAKRNEMWLVVHNVFSGLNREGVKLFNLYRARAKHGTDRTDYVANDKGAYDVHSFAPHRAQLLSAAIVKGDRCSTCTARRGQVPRRLPLLFCSPRTCRPSPAAPARRATPSRLRPPVAMPKTWRRPLLVLR